MLPHQNPQAKIAALSKQKHDTSAGSVNKMTDPKNSPMQEGTTSEGAGPIPIDPEDGWLKRKAKGYLNNRIKESVSDLTGKDRNEGGQSNMKDSPNAGDPDLGKGTPKPNPPGDPTPKANRPRPNFVAPIAPQPKVPNFKMPKFR
jgi:hypothetical protein